MKRIYLINYDIFCQRKKFSLKEWLEKNKEATYEQFCDILVSISVNPPNEDYFNEVKSLLVKNDIPEIKETIVVKKTRKRKKKNEKNNI